jgi:lipoate-protein ligase B
LSESHPGNCFPAFRSQYLGRVPFEEAWELQRQIWEARAEGRLREDILLFMEHDPVFTLGQGGLESNILSRRSPNGGEEIPLVRINRGGEVTYHGPGQLMLYALCDLRERARDVHIHCRRLEEVFLRYLADLGYDGERHSDMPGLWVGREKILSLGVGARRWITMHGVAFNLSPDLRYFELIHPCGEVDGRMTSLERLTGRAPSLSEVTKALIPYCQDVFESEVIMIPETDRFPAALIQNSGVGA